MTSLPASVNALWEDLQRSRALVLHESEGLSQRQADWKPGADDWSIGEVLDHLTMAEVATGKLTTKLTRDAESTGTRAPFPADVGSFTPLPPWPPGRGDAPPVVWPTHGKSIVDLVDVMKATRERTRQSIEKLATLDPRTLTFKHFRLGDLDLAQWWILQAEHDRIHLEQIRAVKASPGFPPA